MKAHEGWEDVADRIDRGVTRCDVSNFVYTTSDIAPPVTVAPVIITVAPIIVMATAPPAATASSTPVHTAWVSEDLAVTVIRVDLDGRVTYQLYAVESRNWALIGIFGLYTDALAEICTWR